jgi:S1-C subfamily serine protease
MQTVKRIRARAAVVALVVLAVVGAGAAYAATRPASRAIGTGVVVIDTSLSYQGATGAGTGMVLTPSGEILTNNHVIAGATTIRVVVPKTSRSYTATVVGYDTSADVAVLQLSNASNLKTVKIGNASALTVGARVTAVGNAGGTGSLMFARGTVTGLERSITVQGDNGASEQLSGLIETDAALRPGDSGGPLVDSAGRVVGMDTAASSTSQFASFATADGYAIPVGTAKAIATEIVAGEASSTVHVGRTAFLGVDLAVATTEDAGVPIAGVVAGGPADAAGLTNGDVITSLAGTTVVSSGDVEAVVLAHRPGETLSVTYLDPLGRSHTASLTLASGPPQ